MVIGTEYENSNRQPDELSVKQMRLSLNIWDLPLR